MSHVVQVQTEIRDPVAIQAACGRLGLGPPMAGLFRLFSTEAVGLGVQLPDWRYPVVCQTDTGKVVYDNYGGHWGDVARLHSLLQAYAVEKAKLEARKQGHTVAEQTLADGAIKLTIHVGEN